MQIKEIIVARLKDTLALSKKLQTELEGLLNEQSLKIEELYPKLKDGYVMTKEEILQSLKSSEYFSLFNAENMKAFSQVISLYSLCVESGIDVDLPEDVVANIESFVKSGNAGYLFILDKEGKLTPKLENLSSMIDMRIEQRSNSYSPEDFSKETLSSYEGYKREQAQYETRRKEALKNFANPKDNGDRPETNI